MQQPHLTPCHSASPSSLTVQLSTVITASYDLSSLVLIKPFLIFLTIHLNRKNSLFCMLEVEAFLLSSGKIGGRGQNSNASRDVNGP